MSQQASKILSVDCRPIRPVGGAIGMSFDLDALRDLGVVDDEGELVDDIDGRQKITDDGRIVIDLNVPADDELVSVADD